MNIYFAILVFTAMLIILAHLSVWSNQQLWRKYTTVGLTIIIMVAFPLYSVELLSLPKKTSNEYIQVQEEVILIQDYVDKYQENLYLWVLYEDQLMPRYYTIPMDNGGREMKDAINKARENFPKQTLVLPSPYKYEKSLENRENIIIHPLPQPKLFEKEPPKPKRSFGA